MRILVTNDDGIGAPGLVALVREMVGVGNIVVVAPERQQSAGGHAITLHKPLRLERVAFPVAEAEAYATNGTPADCVILGCLGLERRPDLVVAGINAGANLGEEVLYSGTVSAAMEAAINGIPAFAISVLAYLNCTFHPAAAFAARLAANVCGLNLPQAGFLNVNVPNCPASEIAGVKVTRLGRRSYLNQLEKRVDPRGRAYYWFSGEAEEADAGEGTDIGATAASFISITPIHFDLTSYESMETLSTMVAALAPEGTPMPPGDGDSEPCHRLQ